MNRLDHLEAQSIYILREARHAFDPIAMLWSLGKDSNVMIWLARKAFLGRVPFPVFHLDTGLEFPEVYAFRDRYAAEWRLDFTSFPCPPLEHVDPSLPKDARLAGRKSLGVSSVVDTFRLRGLIAGIRRDEQPTRAKERVFSPRGAANIWDFRDQPPEFWDLFASNYPFGTHVRVHPLLHWTEVDIWRYIARESIPVCSLYFAKEGRRFRSLGEIGITHAISSSAATVADIIAELSATTAPERAGRSMDHESEDAFERLRTSGYL
ncbi:MAG: sulfate adenylyltransferase subunit CysD [Alphaproteobacteria bacterium]|nr:sulfate adenylyltransferase subunit CysD [Alphaproteobacteria bacterium]